MINKVSVFRHHELTGPTYGKKLGWPMFAWRVILPEKASSQLDILEKFVLSVAEIKNLETTDIFREIGISVELKKTVIQKCKERGYLSENTLTKYGKEMLYQDNGLQIDKNERLIQMYLFVDGVTGDLVPSFLVDKLPKKSPIEVEMVLSYDNKHKRKPNIFEIESKMNKAKLLRRHVDELKKATGKEELAPDETQRDDTYTAQIYEALNSGDFLTDESNSLLDMELGDAKSVEAVEGLDIDGVFEEFEGEQQLDGTFKLSEQTSADDEQKPQNISALKVDQKRNLKFLDVQPELIYVPVMVYGHADTFLNNKTYVISPFSEYEDLWFNEKFMYMATLNVQVKEFVDGLREELCLEFSNRYPFSNDLKIQLFNDFPLIANDAKWQNLREQIEAAESAFLRIEQGDKDFDNYYMRTQRMLELMFYKVLEPLSLRTITATIQKHNYRTTLSKIADELCVTIPKKYFNLSFFDKIKSKVERNFGFSSSKDAALLYVIYVYFNRDIKHLEILRQLPDLLQTVEMIVDARNSEVHYSDKTIDHEKVYKEIREQSEEILRVVIGQILLGNE